LGASFVVSVVVVVVELLGAIGVLGVVVVLDVVDEVLVSAAFESVAGAAGAGAGAGAGATTTAAGAGGGVTVFSEQAASAMTADAMTRSDLFILIPSLGGFGVGRNGRPCATLVKKRGCALSAEH
jgi:hypothetical protein